MAIQANELRIGNYIFIKWSKEYRKIDWLDIRDLAEDRDQIQLQAEPIPLTEDILIATCFEFIERKIDFGVGGYYPNKYWFIVDGVKEYRNGSYPIYKHGFCVGSYKNKKSFYYQSYRHETIGTELKYIHQLQNLYFALTGEELQISF